MKRKKTMAVVGVVIAAIIFAATPGFAEKKQQHATIDFTLWGSSGIEQISLSYERVLSPSFSIQGTLGNGFTVVGKLYSGDTWFALGPGIQGGSFVVVTGFGATRSLEYYLGWGGIFSRIIMEGALKYYIRNIDDATENEARLSVGLGWAL